MPGGPFYLADEAGTSSSMLTEWPELGAEVLPILDNARSPGRSASYGLRLARSERLSREARIQILKSSMKLARRIEEEDERDHMLAGLAREQALLGVRRKKAATLPPEPPEEPEGLEEAL